METQLILVKAKPQHDDRFILHAKVEMTDDNTYARADLHGFPVSFDNNAREIVQEWAEANGFDVHDANQPHGWKIIVTTAPGERWASNAMVYPTWEEAQDALYDLTSRWFAIKHGAIRPATETEAVKI